LVAVGGAIVTALVPKSRAKNDVYSIS